MDDCFVILLLCAIFNTNIMICLLLFKLPQFVAESKMFDLHLLVSVYLSIQEKM